MKFLRRYIQITPLTNAYFGCKVKN